MYTSKASIVKNPAIVAPATVLFLTSANGKMALVPLWMAQNTKT